jgi:hypothetical protein
MRPIGPRCAYGEAAPIPAVHGTLIEAREWALPGPSLYVAIGRSDLKPTLKRGQGERPGAALASRTDHCDYRCMMRRMTAGLANPVEYSPAPKMRLR